MIDPGTQENGEDYLAYNRRRWGSDGWTHSLRAKGRRVGAPFADADHYLDENEDVEAPVAPKKARR